MVGEPTINAFSNGEKLLMLPKGSEGRGNVDTIFTPRKRQRQALYPSISGGTRPETVVERGSNPFLRLLIFLVVRIVLAKVWPTSSKKRTRPFSSSFLSVFLYQVNIYINVISSIWYGTSSNKSID